MQLRHIGPGTSLDVQRGDVVVCIRIHAGPTLAACLRLVLAHTSEHVPIILGAESARETLDSISAPDESSGREVLQLTGPGEDLAVVETMFAIATPADVALLEGDCEVAAAWLEDLRQAAYSDSTVATATALSAATLDPRDAAATVRAQSLRLHPRLHGSGGPCVYVRRSALELAGPIDRAFVAGRGEQSEFSSRCVRSGLSHVLADEVLVVGRGAAGDDRSASGDGSRPLARSLSRVRRALRGLSVVIDARILAGPLTGTKIQVLEVIGALARTEQVRLAAVVPDRLGEDAAASLGRLTSVALLTHDEAARLKADLVHRPFQVNHPGELEFLLALADRLLITQEDLIGYGNPSYFASPEAWRSYRRLTDTALAAADRVMFVSAHARDDAVAEELVDPERTIVVPNGVDHQMTMAGHPAARPLGAESLPDDGEVALCLGANYRHKNRAFALRIVAELQRRHGWRGRLVFAGRRVPHGSSGADEERILAGTPALAEAVIDLGPVSEVEKEWLLTHASLVLYPSVHEGFGLVPFEAAEHDVPCMWAAGTSLSEVLPDSAAEIVPWDAVASAGRALELLRNPAARERNVAAIRAAGGHLSWDAAARKLIEAYEETCDAPSSPVAALERRHRLLSAGMSEDAMRLLGPGGALPPGVERPLLALATHSRLGTPLFGVLRFGYRTSYRLRRWRRRGGAADQPRDRQSLR